MNISQAIHNLRHLDELARNQSVIHKVHPLAKLLSTLLYLIILASFKNTEIASLIPYTVFPVVIFVLSDTPLRPIAVRTLLVMPLILGVGILQPLLDHRIIVLGEIQMSMGWVVFMGLVFKSLLMLVTSLLLIATTGMDQLAMALRMLKVPKLFVLQLLLTYRYIAVLGEELFRMQRAYFLRAPDHKGISGTTWGSFLGQLLLRTFDRGHRIYQSMQLKGFSGEHYTGTVLRLNIKDMSYFILWSSVFVIMRLYNLPMLLGTWMTEVIMK